MKQEELIQKYIQGRLNTAEQAQFDALLKNDLDFAQKVTEHENVHVAIRANEKADLKSHLQQLEATENQLNTSKKPFYKNARLAIAVVLLLIFGLIGNYIVQKANSNETLYATYFEPYPNALQPVKRNSNTKDVLTNALYAYESGQYAVAIEKFDIVLAGFDNQLGTDILFYKAMSLLNLGKENEALNILSKIKLHTTQFTPQIYWYMALIHIKLDEKDKAVEALNYLDTLQTTYKTTERSVLKSKLD